MYHWCTYWISMTKYCGLTIHYIFKLGVQKGSTHKLRCCVEVRSTNNISSLCGSILISKARVIKSGETPQKSLILPPVHTFIKGLVAPLNLMFSYFSGIFGGWKSWVFMIFDKTYKKLTKSIKNNKNYKK